MIEIFLLMLIGKGIFELCKYVKRTTNDDIAKLTNRSRDGLTYVDNNGRMRLLSNNHIVAFDKYQGDEVLRDLKTYEIVKNYTQEKREIERQVSQSKAIQESKTIYCIDFDEHRNDKIKGMRYQNLETGEIYVIRQIGRYRIPIYMTLDGKLVKLVDKNWRYHQMVSKDIDIDIKEEVRKHNEEYKDQPLWNKSLNHLWNSTLDLIYCGKEFRKA